MESSNDQNIRRILEEKIDYWRTKLLDLTRRNRLISFHDYKRSSLYFSSRSLENIFTSLQEGKNINIHRSEENDQLELKVEGTTPLDGNTSEDLPSTQKDNVWYSDYGTEETEKRLYSLYLKSKESLREQGINTLFVALGYLHYFEAKHSEEELIAPLVLVPVEIERMQSKSKHFHNYAVRFLEEDVQINPALQQKLLVEFNIKLPEFIPPDNNDEKSDNSNFLDNWIKNARKAIASDQKWKISEEACIGIFSFQKLQIYLDIKKLADRIFSHPMLQILAGASNKLAGDFSNTPTDKELDKKTKPSEIFQVLDADSSQQEAIEAAKRGLSFVIQGPPGTGKSQTIVNIISELLAQKKKVLFVSEKVAALEVVKNRLDDIGIGRYALELHSYKANKKAVLEQLKSQLNNTAAAKINVDEDGLILNLETSRKSLNMLGEELLEPRGEMKLTIYEARGQLTKLESIPSISISVADPIKITKSVFNGFLECLAALQDYERELSNFYEHPWKGIKLKTLGLAEGSVIKKLISDILSSSNDLNVFINEYESIFNLRPETIVDMDCLGELLRNLTERPNHTRICQSWFFEDLIKRREIINLIQNNLQLIDETSTHIRTHYGDDHIKFDVEEVSNKFNGKFRLSLRIIYPEYWRLRKLVLGVAKTKRTFGERAKDLKRMVVLKKLKTETEDLLSSESKFLETNKITSYSDCQKILEALQWVEGTKLLMETKKIKTTERLLKEIALRETSLFAQLLDEYNTIYINRFRESLRYLITYFAKSTEVKGIKLENLPLQETIGWVSELNSSFKDLSQWIEFNNLISDSDPSLKTYIDFFLKEIRKPEYLIDSYKKRFYEEFLMYAENAVTQHPGIYYTKKIGSFRQYDTSLKEVAKKKIIENLESRKPDINAFSNTHSSEIAILRKETLKKTHHKPLRLLFRDIHNLLFVLKPCFMMSPLSVCQYIDPKDVDEFDTVIFDEASQIMTEDAVSSLIRGKQAIIVGDSQQLPPTRFFATSEDDASEVDEDIEDLESVLDEATTKLVNKTLRWHYRSRDEALIAFSNKFFYDSRLITFPNSQRSETTGVEFVYVPDGIYDRSGSRSNVNEAIKVVKLVEKHIKETPNKSLGVVAFSISQQQAILDQMEIFKMKHPEYAPFFEESVLNEFFVKNLESVQGDERDIMIFSIGYGHDKTGKLTLNFGPINQVSGYRRLNVAVTRAREKNWLVSSFQPEEIDLQEVSNPGVKYLIQYMKYAKYGTDSLESELTIRNVISLESPFEESVYNSLKSRGWDVEAQVGCSGYRIDLAIRHPKEKGRFLLGIECDGSAYHSSATARDRDRLRQGVLEGLGWNIHRIWSYDWMLDSSKELGKIEDKIKSLMDQTVNLCQQELEHTSTMIVEKPNDHMPSPAYNGYAETKLPNHKGGISGFNKAHPSVIEKDVSMIVKTESPIHMELLLKRVARSWGLSKFGNGFRKKLKPLIGFLERYEGLIRDNNYFWYKQIETLPGVRISSEDERHFKYVPICELASLALVLLKNGFSVGRNDLILEMARAYRHSRLSPSLKSRLDKAIGYLVTLEKVKVSGDVVEII